MDRNTTLANAAMLLLDDICKSLKETVDQGESHYRYQVAVSKGAINPDLSTLTGTGAWYCADNNGNITTWDQKVADIMKLVFGDFVAQYCSSISMDGIDADVQATLAETMQTWPDNMEPGRLAVIEKAASLVNKGCKYSQPKRSPKSSSPAYLDCSSYVAWSFTQMGYTDIPTDAYTGTFISLFKQISESELIPGDVALNNKSMAGGNSNHIGIYIGKNSSGQNCWLHCTSSGINGPQIRVGNGNFAVFYRYPNW